jgi:hypothetical protein
MYQGGNVRLLGVPERAARFGSRGCQLRTELLQDIMGLLRARPPPGLVVPEGHFDIKLHRQGHRHGDPAMRQGETTPGLEHSRAGDARACKGAMYNSESTDQR